MKVEDIIPENVDPTAVLAEPHGQSTEFHEIRNIAVADVDPNPWNPNQQDEKTFNRLVQEIKDVGFLEPIHVVPYVHEETGATRYLILGGEHRWRAATVAGMENVPALLLKHKRFADVDFQKAMTVRLNALRGKLNKEKMVKLFHDFADRYSEEEVRELFAFTDKDAWNKLLGDTRKGLKKSGMSAELLAEFDKNALTARSVEDLSSIIKHLYEMYSDTVPFGFMVFTYGKKEHIYIVMTSKLQKAMKTLTAAAKSKKINIAELMEAAIERVAKDLDSEN